MSQFDVPILLLIFNRIDTVKVVLDRISKIKPKKLYISGDGPRNKNEEKVVLDIRNYLLSNIDWDCKIKTNFNEYNKGCSLSVSSAIDWVFNFEDRCIILEDDCVPDLSFFEYCKVNLDKYQNDTRVMLITGTNYYPENKDEVFFSRYINIWGWATWKRAWMLNDYYMSTLPLFKKLNNRAIFYYNYRLTKHTLSSFESINDMSTSWAIRWTYSCISNSGLCITPNKNLIKNIGEIGEHSGSCDFLNIDTTPIDIKLIKYPEFVYPNANYDIKVASYWLPSVLKPKRFIAYLLDKIGLYNQFIKLWKRRNI